MLVCVVQSCPFLVGRERADLLVVVFVVFCHFPKYVRIKGEVGAVKLV